MEPGRSAIVRRAPCAAEPSPPSTATQPARAAARELLPAGAVDDPRWGALGSTLLAAVALIVAISDPATGHTVNRRQGALIVFCVLLAPIVLFVDSTSVVGLVYLLPVALLVTATLPVTLSRVLHHRRVTHETVLGALC